MCTLYNRNTAKLLDVIDSAGGNKNNMTELTTYDIAICLDEGQMSEEEIAEAIEDEIAIREHEYNTYLEHMENVYGISWRELEAESERNFRRSLGLEEG
jgi:hypothetical protein